MQCPFCEIAFSDDPSRHVLSNSTAFAIYDKYPVSPGHALIIPRRHVGSFFETTPDERADLLTLLDSMRRVVIETFEPAAFNIGVNDGPAAGQTVPHLHMHLIPRYSTEREDPRGGVRWVIPAKAKYWD